MAGLRAPVHVSLVRADWRQRAARAWAARPMGARAPAVQPASSTIGYLNFGDRAMSTTSTSALLHTRDSIVLPDDPEGAVDACSRREDTYPICVTRSLSDTVDRISELVGDVGVALLSDDRVYELHGRRLQDEIAAAGVEADVFIIPAGEANKSLDEAIRAWHWLEAGPLGRCDMIINVGGGVVIDLGGWVAGGYMRGMKYLNVPTTLVGQVDAGIGGKVAVNRPRAKNLIGGFHQPVGVVSHIGFLDTLGQREVNAGMSEVIKKALIASPDYFEFIEQNADRLLARDPDALARLVGWAGVIKAELIARDPYELDSRRTLGFGHALAHPLETVTGFGPILHGEAVAFGMSVEMRIAVSRGVLKPETFNRAMALLRRFEQPTCANELRARVEGRALLAHTDKVTLARGGSLCLVLLHDIGESVIDPHVTNDELRPAVEAAGLAW
jgi:3-dehydroquinate synthase